MSPYLLGFVFFILFFIIKNISVLFWRIWLHYKHTRLFNNVGYLRSLGKWAIITGATDGIGLEYARQLGKIGINLILISRSADKLNKVAEEIKSESKIAIETIAVDFTQQSIYDFIEKEINKKVGSDGDIGILINNVGMTQDYPHEFYNYHGDIPFFTNLINCNILSVIGMSQLYLNYRRHNKSSSHGGLIINVASASSVNPIPLSAMYSSSKRAVATFSRALQRELKEKSIQVHLILPFFVQTKFIGKFTPPVWLTPNAKHYVLRTLAKAGFENESFGTFSHEIQGWFYSLIPVGLSMMSSARIHKKRQQILMAQK